MATAMAGFSLNDALTKFLTLHMNFGQVMLVRGLFAVVLIGALATQRKALRPLRASCSCRLWRCAYSARSAAP